MILTLTDDNADTNSIQELIDNQHADKTNHSDSRILTTTSAPRLTIINRMTPSKHTYQVILKTLARLASIDDYDADIVYISDYDDLLLDANEFDGCGLNAGGIASRSNTIILNTDTSNTMMMDRIARIVSMIHHTCTGTHVLLNTTSNLNTIIQQPDNNVNTAIASIDNNESINIKRSLSWINADGFTNIDLTAFTENNSFTVSC